MPDGELTEPLRGNLRALRRTYREYFDVLSALIGEAHGSARRAALPEGSADLEGAAQEEAHRLFSDEATLYVVLEPGLGYLPLALLQEVEKRQSNSFILIVEDRLDRFGAALSTVDWRTLIESASTELLLGKPETVVRAFLERHPAIALLSMVVVTDSGRGNETRAAALVERLAADASRLRISTESELAVADDAIRSRRARKEPRRVLLVGAEFGYLSDLIAAGLRESDVTVEVRTGDARTARGLRMHDWVRDIAMLSPDVVIWMNRPELSRVGSEVLRALEIVSVLWSVDSPYRMRVSQVDLGPVDVFLSFDPSYLRAASALGASRSAQLSIAAGIRPLPGMRPSDAKWPARLGPDVSFVGSLGELRVRDLRDALQSDNPEMLSVLERLAAEETDPGAAYEKMSGEPYEGAPCFYVQEMRSQRRRLAVLSAFHGFSMKIYGGFDWAAAGTPLAVHHTGRPPRYGYELASIYYHSRINVNVFHDQCVDSTNSRVYDVLAAGGFLLTEHRPCLTREFEVGRHLVTFTTLEEAREKAAYYLDHPAEREAIAREGQRHVLQNHTFTLRCRRILEIVEGPP